MSLYSAQPYILGSDEGQQIGLARLHANIKATAKQTGGCFTLIELTLPAGFATPVHTHFLEDEALYVQKGSLTVLCNGRTMRASPGSFVFLPRSIPHGVRVDAQAPATLLCLSCPAGFEKVLIQTGTLLAGEDEIVLGIEQLAHIAAPFSIEVLEPIPEDGYSSSAHGARMKGDDARSAPSKLE